MEEGFLSTTWQCAVVCLPLSPGRRADPCEGAARAEHRAGGGLWTLPEFRPFPAQVTTLSALPASRAGGGWTLLCPPSSTPPLPPPQGAWECREGGREGMPEAQSTACACFPIWNSRSRLPLCSKAMETQGSPLIYVCAGKGGGRPGDRGHTGHRITRRPASLLPLSALSLLV